ncbi:MAG: prolyl oligopeptidase family serine peptidase [Myxococcota bacterium]
MRCAVLVAAVLALVLVGCRGTSPSPPPPAVTPTPPSLPPSSEPNPTPPPGPPLARRDDIVDTLHGVEVADPYRWLEDAESEETQRFLRAHGAYSRAQLDGLPGRPQLVARLEALSYLETVSPPRRRGTRFFFTRRHRDKEKAVHYWREGRQGTERVLIDPNTLSPDGSTSVRGLSVSWDGRWVAYKQSANNADEATLMVREVATGRISDVDTIEGAKYANPSWDRGSRGFYYTRIPVDPAIPTADRPGFAAVYYHRLGTDPADDALVHEKTGDPRVFIQASASRDGAYLFVSKYYGWAKTDVVYRDLRRGDSSFQPLAVGLDAKFYPVPHRGRIYVLTNHAAPRFRLLEFDPRRPAVDDWREVVPQHPTAVLERARILGGRWALTYLDKASSRLFFRNLAGDDPREVALPGIGSLIGPTGHPDDDTAYYGFSSYITPVTIVETSVTRGGAKPYFELEVPADPAPYLVEQVRYPSRDNTSISMFIVRRRDLEQNGETPFLLHGYGGFNISERPRFRASYFAWLEAGGAIALPNLRGGGEYGEAWHRAGMLDRKQNVFDDFIAAAEWLIDNGYTSASRLAIRGGSNGGLLVGAAMVQRPELFRAVVCAVPLLDMVRYHRFGSGKTWISEYGSADEPGQFSFLYAYSPYHRVVPGTRYPALLMLTSDSDDRVDPLHARKFVAAIRHASTSGRPVLLRVEDKAGHGGGDKVEKRVRQQADTFAFLKRELGMSDTP